MVRYLDIPYYIELQRQMENILLYVSCHESNFNTYSIKLENLFVSICSFFDSLCQTYIRELAETGHSFTKQSEIKKYAEKVGGAEHFNIGDYRLLLEHEFFLSQKEVNLNVYEDNFYGNPISMDPNKIRGYVLKPFIDWSYDRSPFWWEAFTSLKHDRMANIRQSTLRNTINSLAATYIVLTFRNEEKFKGGKVTPELYSLFLPLYWTFKGRVMSGIIMWR